MTEKLLRVGTTYIPVTNVKESTLWYAGNLGAELNYEDEDKAILDLANQSFFLVKSPENESANFTDAKGSKRFSLTFEVNGESALRELQKDLQNRGVTVGDIEDRGHAGNNFVFSDPDGNLFDVWSELSPSFKENRA